MLTHRDKRDLAALSRAKIEDHDVSQSVRAEMEASSAQAVVEPKMEE
ncbi:MAG TPA: hypothetical protein VH393_03645 [Ktedonobacterales bacterium]